MNILDILRDILTKKLDVTEDCLRTVFNPNTQMYELYKGNKSIEYKQLNRKSKKYLDNKNKQLQNNPYILKLELDMAKRKKRFEKLKQLGYSCDSFETLGETNGTMSKEIESLLRSLINEENVLLGIHRIGMDDSPEKIEDILINGLKITGHQDGAVNCSKVLKHNVSYYADNETIIKELMYADLYKNSKGSILIRIPDNDLAGNIFTIDKNGAIRLKPQYIIGYIPLEEKHHLETIITPSQIKKGNTIFSYSEENKPYIEYTQEKQTTKTR